MKRNVNIWKSLDRLSIALFLLLLMIGWFNIYAAVFNEERSGLLDMTQLYGKQFVWIMAALAIAFIIVVIDSRFYFFFSWFIYGAVILLLLLVLVLGKEINGARSWFNLGPFTLQPSEFAKAGTALALAAYLSSKRHDLKSTGIMPAIGIVLLPVLLIVIQPDWGSAVVFFSLFIVMYREGMSPYLFVTGLLMIILFFLTLIMNNLYLIIGLVVLAFILAWLVTRRTRLVLVSLAMFLGVGLIVYLADLYVIRRLGLELVIVVSLLLLGTVVFYYNFMIRKITGILVVFLFLTGSAIYINTVDYAFNNILKPHQKERVSILLGLKTDTHGTGYNVNQSIISVGSGGFAGKGYLQGTQTKFKFVPAQSTDFIFCTIGEEWGFLGSFVLIAIYLTLLVRLIILAERQRSVFSRVYGYGVVSILFVHVFINIGMAIGIVPVIGIPLPFLSYGGSSLWGFTILLFIFLRLDASRTEYLV